LEQDRFATKEVDAPQDVLSVPDDGKPRRTIIAWSRAVVLDEDTPDNIFIGFDTECVEICSAIFRQPKRGFRRFISMTA
jgi:hypothetical protein